MNIQDYIIYNKTIPKRAAVYADFPDGLSKEICEYLKCFWRLQSKRIL